MRFFTKIKKTLSSDREKVHDVFLDARRNVISLRPHTVQIEFSVSSLYRLYKKNRPAFLGGCLCVILVVVFGVYRSVTWADSLVLYPSTCLGGWSNPQLAEGKPDTSSTADHSTFTESNSAVLAANTSSDIFCGGFSGNIPDNAQPTQAVLTFSWTATTPPVVAPAPIVDPSASPITISTSTPLDDSVASPTPGSDAVSAPLPPPEVPASPADSSIAPSAPTTPDTSSTDAPVSLLDLLTPKAHAQDDSTTTSKDASSGFLEVDYTLDGNTWQVLGTIDATQMANASFMIPIPSGATWKDISNLQVGLKSLSSIDSTPTVYLDGMILTAEYDSSSQQAVEKAQVAQMDADSSLEALLNANSSTSTPLIDTPSFTDDAQSSVILHPHFIDGSTNVAFYLSVPPQTNTDGTSYWWQAEQLDSLGNAPFSTYWEPSPAEGSYVTIEYFNDAQQFSCSGLSLTACITNSHFIRESRFEITSASSSDATMSQ